MYTTNILPHLEGNLLELQSNNPYCKRTWKAKHVVVSRDILYISKNKGECDKNNYLHEVNLLQVEVTATTGIHGSSERFIFKLSKYNSEEHIFACNSADEYSHWFTNLTRIKEYWTNVGERETDPRESQHLEIDNACDSYTCLDNTFADDATNIKKAELKNSTSNDDAIITTTSKPFACGACANIDPDKKPVSVVSKEQLKWILIHRSNQNYDCMYQLNHCFNCVNQSNHYDNCINQSNQNGSYRSKLNDSYNYLCLLGSHIRYTKEGWELVDNCKIVNNIWELDSDIVAKGEQFNIGGGYICIWIPKCGSNPGQWIIKQDAVLADSQNPVKTCNKVNGSKRETPCLTQACQLSMPLDISCRDTRQLSDSMNSCRDTCQLSDSMNSCRDTCQLSDSMNSITKQLFVSMETSDGDTAKRIKDDINIISHITQTYSIEPIKFIIPPAAEVLPPEKVFNFKHVYIQPLQATIMNICRQFEGLAFDKQRCRGDDLKTSAIGWLIRNDFCTVITKLLRIGLSNATSVLQNVFGKRRETTMWMIVKEISLSYGIEDIVSIVDSIKTSKWLTNDDMKYRFFICELLNRNSMNGSDKLISTWFQHFPMQKDKLVKYYVTGSFWRMECNEEFRLLFEEAVRALKLFNGIPFCLHEIFEIQVVQLQENSRGKYRQRQHSSDRDDAIICMFE